MRRQAALGIYSAERSLIDVFRLRHQEGEDVAIEARLIRMVGLTGGVATCVYLML